MQVVSKMHKKRANQPLPAWLASGHLALAPAPMTPCRPRELKCGHLGIDLSPPVPLAVSCGRVICVQALISHRRSGDAKMERKGHRLTYYFMQAFFDTELATSVSIKET